LIVVAGGVRVYVEFGVGVSIDCSVIVRRMGFVGQLKKYGVLAGVAAGLIQSLVMA
jgi:hypothetical protein